MKARKELAINDDLEDLEEIDEIVDQSIFSRRYEVVNDMLQGLQSYDPINEWIASLNEEQGIEIEEIF